jgi:hypothetical protein
MEDYQQWAQQIADPDSAMIVSPQDGLEPI